MMNDQIKKNSGQASNLIIANKEHDLILANLEKVTLKETNINKQIEKIYNFFKPEAESKGINFAFKNSLPTKEAVFFTDRKKIYTVLIHLIKKAIKNTQEGSIEFGYAGTKSISNKTELMFFVKDTGNEIPKAPQKAIFESLTQSDILDKMAYEGNGYGLSISKAYVALPGGKIWEESDEEKAVKFYFSLPYRIDLAEN